MTIDIQPSSYYDQENGGKIPIFTPTMDQFQDFKLFMTSIEEYGKLSGIVKVIPPKEWKDQLPELKNLDQIKITKPITQHIMGGRGIYTQTNIENRKEYTLKEWYDICNQDDHRPPKVTVEQPPSSKNKKQAAAGKEKKEAVTVSSKLALRSDKITLNKKQDLSKPNEDTINLTIEQYKEIERHYWRNITFNQPMYGADMLGSLFDESVKSWNVQSLDNTLNKLGVTLPGVNSPYLYFGMWKATFAWHVEDMDLYSINYIHFGAPKQWYIIQPCHQKRFETFMQTTFFNQYKECHEFLRHKTFIVSPKVLQNNNIPVQKCVQQPGEFIITFPFGYHSGYNLDWNAAESANFALESWIDIGKKAKHCTCVDDSVVIDVDALLNGPSVVEVEEEEKAEIEEEHKNRRKRQKIEKKPTQPKQEKVQVISTSCILCSTDSSAIANHTLLDSACGKYKNIHKICAEAVTETYIQDDRVYGIDQIPSSRWKLLCLFCKQKGQGACMQCCFGKCWKSFHATCAIIHGATMNRVSSSFLSSSSSSGKSSSKKNTTARGSQFDGYCSNHDPKRISEKKATQKKYLKEMAHKLKTNLNIYTKWRGGGYYQGTIIECNPTKQACRILLQDGVTRNIPWRDIFTSLPSQK